MQNVIRINSEEVKSKYQKTSKLSQRARERWFNDKTSDEDLRKTHCLVPLWDSSAHEILKILNIDYRKFYETELDLELGEPNEEGWVPNVICPFHDDTNPSLGINLKNGHYHCFGCEEAGNLIQFYQYKHKVYENRALIELADFSGFHWDRSRLQSELNRGEPTKIYDYLDQNNELRFQVCRFKNKQFRCRSSDHVWSIKGIELIPYRLPQVLKANTVFIVEGEKDADNLIEIGLTASCNPLGAGAWRPIYNKHFRGKQIIVLPDNDAAGHNHALKVAQSLHRTAKSIKIVELPGLPEKGDVTDWLEAGNTKDELLELCREAPFWHPGSTQITSNPEQTLSTISITELLARKFEKISGVIDNGILPEGGGLIIAGESEIGKSLIILDWAINLALGRNILDGLLPVPKARKAIIFQSEIPLYLVKGRIMKMKRGLENANLPNSIFFANPEFKCDLQEPGCVEEMICEVEKCEADIFILDPLSSFHGVNENDNSLMRSVLDQVTHISRITGASSVVVHHFGKPVADRDDSYRLRGASAIKDWCDTLITLTAKAHEHKTLRRLTFEKVRHGPKKKPILLERDNETFIHTVTEEDMILTPKQLQQLLIRRLGGRVDKQTDLIEAVINEHSCSEKTVKKAINEAASRQLISKQKSGRNTIITALE